MKADIFSHCITSEKLTEYLSIVKSHAEEVGIPADSAFLVEDTGLENLKYFYSISRGRLIYINFFTYGTDSCIGLAASRVGSNNIQAVLECKYLSFGVVHSCLWFAKTLEGIDVLIAHNKEVLTNIIDSNVFGIKNLLLFVCVDTPDSKGIICVDLLDVQDGLFSPDSVESFNEFFMNKIFKYGYNGKFDSCSVSGLLNMYYKVVNIISGVDYKVVEL